jgi:hypothetical protein
MKGVLRKFGLDFGGKDPPGPGPPDVQIFMDPGTVSSSPHVPIVEGAVFKCGNSFQALETYLSRRGIVIVPKAHQDDDDDGYERILLILLQHATGLFGCQDVPSILSDLQEDMGLKSVLQLEVELGKAKACSSGKDYMKQVLSDIHRHLGLSLCVNVRNLRPIANRYICKVQVHENSEPDREIVIWEDFGTFSVTDYSMVHQLPEKEMEALLSDLLLNQDFLHIFTHVLKPLEDEELKVRVHSLLTLIDSLDSVANLIQVLEPMTGDSGVEECLQTLKLIRKLLQRDSKLSRTSFASIKDSYVRSLEEAAESILRLRIGAYYESLKEARTEREKLEKETEALESSLETVNKEVEKGWARVTQLQKELNSGTSRDQQLKLQLEKQEAELKVKDRDLLRAQDQLQYNQFKVKLMGSTPSYQILSLAAHISGTTLRSSEFLLNHFGIREPLPLPSFLSQAEKSVRVKECAGIVRDLMTNPKIQSSHTDGHVIDVTGRFILLSQVLPELTVSLECGNATEVRFIGAEKIFIDAHLENESWNGINVLFRAPAIEVMSNVVIDTSGDPGPVHNDSFAPDGAAEGRDGIDGSSGLRGENGGHVLIMADSEIVRIDRLTVRADGGPGSDGQHGGKGQFGTEGSDGRDGNAREDDDKYYVLSRGTSGTLGGEALL